MSNAARLRRFTALLRAFLNRRSANTRLVMIEPCYWIHDSLDSASVILDLGLGFDADFSCAMIERYGLTAWGFDPTRKHADGLQDLATKSEGHFRFRPVAIGPSAGTTTFNESAENVSGSLMPGHVNIRRDTVTPYRVDVITLDDAFDHLPRARADLVKMDIEGPEYSVIDAATDKTLRRADQWCIEFHHDLIDGLTFQMTKACVRRFESVGFRTYTRDNINYLFFRADLD